MSAAVPAPTCARNARRGAMSESVSLAFMSGSPRLVSIGDVSCGAPSDDQAPQYDQLFNCARLSRQAQPFLGVRPAISCLVAIARSHGPPSHAATVAPGRAVTRLRRLAARGVEATA